MALSKPVVSTISCGAGIGVTAICSGSFRLIGGFLGLRQRHSFLAPFSSPLTTHLLAEEVQRYFAWKMEHTRMIGQSLAAGVSDSRLISPVSGELDSVRMSDARK
jgi:hypothetical protein